MNRKSLLFTLGSFLLGAGAALAFRQEGMPAPAKPSPQHAIVKKMAGAWEVTVAMGDMVEKKKSTVMLEPVGELWVAGTWRGYMGDQPFTGHLIQGYSQEKQKLVSVWVDSISSEVMMGEGTWDEATKTSRMLIRSVTKPGDPPMTEVSVFKDDDHFTTKMSMPGPDGKDMPMMTFEYTRKAGATGAK